MLGQDLISIHFDGFTELSKDEDYVTSENDESDLEEEYYAHIIELDIITEKCTPSSSNYRAVHFHIQRPNGCELPTVETINLRKVKETNRIKDRRYWFRKRTCKLDRCLVDVLNNLFLDYNVCEFELAKKLKVFGLQTEGYDCIISELYIVGHGLYCIRTMSQFTLPRRVSDLCYLYELFRAMFVLREELVKSLRVI
ncbi:9010_t:CDS:2 [Funneliformis geosporum]|uniref:9010_t:CDS:1 n=1 Tax=Funneliformis geosporum TaxID=1117311 RepID=A0A9W4SYK2_9GLOM|nr:9010_t:CDS:2 [Funneliformis geosporum]